MKLYCYDYASKLIIVIMNMVMMMMMMIIYNILNILICILIIFPGDNTLLKNMHCKSILKALVSKGKIRIETS